MIGVCRAGPDAEGLGRDHWNEMLAYPRKPITHWHALCEVRDLKWLIWVHKEYGVGFMACNISTFGFRGFIECCFEDLNRSK